MIQGNNTPARRTALRLRSSTLTIFVIFVIMCAFMAVVSPAFIKITNVLSTARSFSAIAIAGIGVSMIIITGGIDLSLGSVYGLAGVVSALAITAWGVPLIPALGLGIAAGCVVGALNGLMVVYLKLPPFIATLGAQMALRGLAYIMTDSKPVYIQNVPAFKLLAQHRLFGVVPLPVLYTIALAFVAAFLLRRTVIGRNVFAVGSNEEAARLSGISVAKIRIFAYLFSGVMAAVAGIIMSSRVTSGQPNIAIGYEANAVASAVIGGASMRGGHGSIAGSILGAFILGVLINGLNLMNVSQNWQTFAIGVIMVLAVWIDKLRTAEKD